MTYLVCKKCGGYYELQEGESAEDFETCQCGGQLLASNTINLPENTLSEPQDEEKTGKLKICPNCGSEISQYSIICRVCGEKIDVDLEKEPHQQDFADKSRNTQKINSQKEDLSSTQLNNQQTGNEQIGEPHDQILDDETSNQVDNERDNEIEEKKPKEKPADKKNTIFCPYCGKENNSDADLCKYCHKEMDIEKLKIKSNIPPEKHEKEHELYVCPRCGAEISEHSIVCRSCGKSLDSPEKISGSETTLVCSQCGKKEVDSAAEYCKACGSPLRTSKGKLDSYSDDYLAMFSSRPFLIYLAVSVILPAIIGFIVAPQNIALIFIIVGLGFSFSYRSNSTNCMLGGLLMGIIGYLSELMFHSLWASTWDLSGELTLLFIFAAFGLIGALIGNQLLERSIVV